MEYFFEKDQPIDFRITGTVNGAIKTSLPNIIGSRGQTLNKKIEGIDGITLEVKGYSYKSKMTSTLKFSLSIMVVYMGKAFYIQLNPKEIIIILKIKCYLKVS